MPLRNARPLTFKPTGVTDAIDGTNAPNGSLYAAVNLVPSMHTRHVWVPRPAVTKLFDFSGDTGETGEAELLLEIGQRLWGFIQSNTFPGKSVPFCFDFSTSAFVPIQGVNVGNLPNSTSNSGDWIPPTMAQIGSFLIFTHPGFTMPNAFGWIDQSGFADTATGNTTINNNQITGLSKNTLLAGWLPGMTISGTGIAPGTTITQVSVDGLTVTMSHPATATQTGAALSVTGGTPAAPLWAAGNLNTNPLPDIARSVRMFNGRAWYAVKNAAVFSDSGDPLQRTNANQVLTIQNGLDITAMATQPFANQTVIGGVVQALLLFQADSGIWQITGDPATTNLALNFVSPLGTLAPLSLVSVPTALRFVAPDGVRQISLDGTISPPLGANGDGVAMPFVNAPYPSRICAAYNEDVYRVSVTNYTAIGGSVVPTLAAAEYFYHEKLGIWSGPHSDPARLITASDRPATNHGFVMFRLKPSMPVLGSGGGWTLATGAGMLGTGGQAPGQATSVWFSNTRPMIDSEYFAAPSEPLNWVMQTSLLPDSADMFENAMVETSIALALSPLDSASLAVLDETGVQLDRVNVAGFEPKPRGTQLADMAGGIWGQAIWGQALWGVRFGGAILTQRQIDWHTTLVFKQASLVVTGLSDANIAIGNLYLRYQRTGYMLTDPSRFNTLGLGFGVT